jgi:hypothetical protein
MQTDLRYTMKSALRDSLSLAEVSARLPPTRGGRPVHVQTIRNWIVDGRKVPDGRIFHLLGTRFPHGWRVLPEDLDDFLAQLTAACMGIDDPSGPPALAPTTEARARELSRTDRELDAIGLGTGPAPKPTTSREAKARARRAAAKS